MAYNTANPPVKLSLGALAGFNTTESGGTQANGGLAGNIWLYKSADVIATVEGAGYFSNGVALGMQPGDLVIIIDVTTPHAYLESVGSVNLGTGTASMSGTHVTTW